MEIADYDEYLRWVFVRPVNASPEDRDWFADLPDDEIKWTGDVPVLATHLTRMFEDPAPVFARFSRGQLGQGLWFLAFDVCSGHVSKVLDDPDEGRAVRLIATMHSLFKWGFAPKVTGAISEITDPVDVTCNMWFDLSGDHDIVPRPASRRAHDEAFIAVLRRVLAMDSEPCQLAALHGLGHWHDACPAASEAAIDEWLARGGHSPYLVDYAAKARTGHVP